jgi:hypothetical protein
MTHPLKALTKETATGNGTASTADMIRLSSSVLGSLNLLRRDMNRRFGDQSLSTSVVEGKVDALDARLGCIEEARRNDALLSAQAKTIATDNAAIAKETAAEAKTTATDRNADRAAHALSRNQRLAIMVAAASAAATLLLSPGFAALIANVARFLGDHT